MNYKNNLSLLLASTMVSGMFSAAVNATAYKFTTSTGNLRVYTVTQNANNKNIAAAAADADAINLNLSAGNTATQRFMFAVKDEFLNGLAANDANEARANAQATLAQRQQELDNAVANRDTWTDARPAADNAAVQQMQADLQAATLALNAAQQGPGARAITDVNGALSYAKALKKAVEIMAKVKGEMTGKQIPEDLYNAVRALIEAENKAMRESGLEGRNAWVAGDAAANLGDKDADATSTNNRIRRVLTQAHDGTGNAATNCRVGICVADEDTFTQAGMAVLDAHRYKVVGSAYTTVNGVQDFTGAPNPALDLEAAVPITDAMLVVGQVLPNPDGLVQPGAHMDTADVAGHAGALDVGNTFLTERKANVDDIRTPVRVLAQTATTEDQAKNFCKWMDEYFLYRAKNFLTDAEAADAAQAAAQQALVNAANVAQAARDAAQGIVDAAGREAVNTGAINIKWLGAGATKTTNLNRTDDYEVKASFSAGENAVAVRKVEDTKVYINDENGEVVTPLIIEFVANTVAKDTPVKGTLKITSAGKTQEVPFSGTVSKTGSIDINVSEDQTVPNGFTFTKDAVSEIIKSGTGEFTINILPTGSKTGNPIVLTLENSKQMRTGARKVTAEVYEDDNANTLYAPEDKNGDSKNDIALFKMNDVSTGPVEVTIPLDLIGGKISEQDDGKTVIIYLTTEEKLEALKEKKAAAKKAEAKASASDGAVDSEQAIKGKIEGGNVVFTINPKKVNIEDDTVFMISKDKLNIEDTEGASDEEDKDDEEEEDEDEAEDEEEEKEKAEGEEERVEGEEATTEDAAVAATAGNGALTTEGTVEEILVEEATPDEKSTSGEVSANATNGVAATGATAVAGLFGTMALASLAAGALATKKNKK